METTSVDKAITQNEAALNPGVAAPNAQADSCLKWNPERPLPRPSRP